MHFKRRFDAFQYTRAGAPYAKLGSSASEDLLSPATNPRDELCWAHTDALMRDSVASHARQLEIIPKFAMVFTGGASAAANGCKPLPKEGCHRCPQSTIQLHSRRSINTVDQWQETMDLVLVDQI